MTTASDDKDDRSGRGEDWSSIVPQNDPVNHPVHYISQGMEAINVIEAYGLPYFLGNVVKYILRADRKGKPLEDLKKAQFYLNREILRRERG